jgi:hypothetical protein
MSSPSRLAGISKTIDIEENLLSKNVNLKMSQKYLMATRAMKTQIQKADRMVLKDSKPKNLLITNANIKAQL